MNGLRTGLRVILVIILSLCALGDVSAQKPRDAMEWVRVADDQRGFALAESGRRFVPWGFNYDRDDSGRLIEDYWTAEWPKVEEDFREMAALGANVVRVHLQVSKFLRGPKEPNRESLDRLGRLLALAERCRLYLDLTGLGCYHKADVPPWYDALCEEERWSAQAVFWESIAERCAKSPAVFCYDLMNEPIVPGGKRELRDWLAPPFAGKCFVQFITLDPADRPREEIARRWIQRLSGVIHKHDPRHLITVGFLPWDPKWGHLSGFVPETVAPELDYLSVHIYPEKDKVDEALMVLKKFAVGKPVVIEETFPLKCSSAEYRQFLEKSRKFAAGWISFYWGKTREEYRRSGQLGDALIEAALGAFLEERDRLVRP
jgi:hypothetical protein